MLNLLNEQNALIGSFHSYSEIIQYIHHSQIYQLSHRNIPGYPSVLPPGQKDDCWRFVYYKHSELNIIYSCMKEPPITGLEKEAFDQGLDLIEIHHNNRFNPVQVPVTAKLDIELLKKEWCEAYCDAHGFKLTEFLSGEHISEPSITGGSNDLAV